MNEENQTQANEHRWSGWPGAYCLDCGVEDALEVCVGTCEWLWQFMPSLEHPEGLPMQPCPTPGHKNGPCSGAQSKLAGLKHFRALA